MGIYPQTFLPKPVSLQEICDMNGGTGPQMDDDFIRYPSYPLGGGQQ